MSESRALVQLLNKSLLITAIAIMASLLVWFLIQRYRQLMAKLRNQQKEIANYQRQDLQRQGYCKQAGHDVDENCYCRRCLISQHEWEVIGYEETWIEDEPGALYLSSDFQPTGHLEREEKRKCKRCGYS